MENEKTKPRWTKTEIKRVVDTVLIVVIAIMSALGYISQDAPESNEATARGTTTNFTDLDLSGTLTVDGASTLTGATTLTGASTHTGAVTAASTMAVAGDITLSGLLLSSFANETITNGEVLTPTVTTYALDSGGAVTMTLAASASEGQILILIGDDANNIIIDDSAIRTSTGAALTIGQYDVVAFIYQDSEWLELLIIANS